MISGIGEISNTGWVVICFLGFAVIVAVLAIVYRTTAALTGKNLKTRLFEITENEKNHQAVKKELAMAEGKDQLENQCQVAKNILKELRIKIYEKGVERFALQEKKDLVIFELITHRIVDRLNYDIKNDLTRNHITTKTNYELEQYTRAKARGYYSMIKDRFYTYNEYLPEYNLAEVIEVIPLSDVETLFKDVYFSARRITGVNGENNQ